MIEVVAELSGIWSPMPRQIRIHALTLAICLRPCGLILGSKYRYPKLAVSTVGLADKNATHSQQNTNPAYKTANGDSFVWFFLGVANTHK